MPSRFSCEFVCYLLSLGCWRCDVLALQVDWGWWVVSIPAWLLYAGRLFSWCLNKVLAFYLANEIKELEHCTEVRRQRQAAFIVLRVVLVHYSPAFATRAKLGAGGEKIAVFVLVACHML